MKSIAIIPARYASTRFPGKPLLELKGKSMIRRVYEQVLKAKSFDAVWVATDDERIFKEVEAFRGNVLMTSEECSNGTERCLEAMQQLGDYDILVNVQGDEPFIHPEDLDKLVHAFKEDEVEIASLKKRIDSKEEFVNSNRVKVVCKDSGEASYFSRSPIPFSKDSSPSNAYKHIGVYAFRTSILKDLLQLPAHPIEKSESLEQLRWLLAGYRIYLLETEYDPIGIDHPDDVSKVLALLGA